MAAILDTNGTSSELNKLILGSKEKLYMISPYLKLTDNIKILVQSAEKASPNIDIRLLYRSDNDKEYLREEDKEYLLKQLKNADIYSLANLHAKCYLNEQTAIITSMNLYEHSQQNNWEMGIKIDRSTEPEIYEDVYSQVSFLFSVGKKYEKKILNFGNIVSQAGYVGAKLKKVGKIVVKDTCFCIRCGKNMDYDKGKPLCPSCFKSWSRYMDKSYTEKHCHYCGKVTKTSFARPFCMDCYKEVNQ